ncbi:MAG: class I SAM-dependent methyltransferase, partial [Candidatus Omnitrophica bacterium]|nr:class I SAM-dependent methyltransferase [Candidatus Omnitrophota bacterium]
MNMRCPLCHTKQDIIKIYSYKSMLLYRCCDCGMMFQDYDTLRKLNGVTEEEVYDNSLKTQIAKKSLKRIINKCSFNNTALKVLEIGTGDGVLASLLIKSGFYYRGIEPSSFLYQNSINRFPELKGKVHNCSLDDSGISKSDFNLVILIDTLEHVPEPVLFLSQIKEYLVYGGMLYVEIPNESFLYLRGIFRKAIGLYSGFPTHPNHLNLFTPLTIRKTMEQADFEIKISGQITVLGDYQRILIVFKKRSMFLARIISLFFMLTKLDILFQQGNIFVIC